MTKTASLLKLIHIHPLFWLAAGLAALTAHFLELCMLALIIMVHEFGHAAAAAFYSWRIKKISLLPFGGVAEMDEHGNRPWKEEAIVTLAGPVQHLWLMAAAYFLHSAGIITDSTYAIFIKYNLMIFAFNLFPIWPLDGGKLLFLLLSARNPFPKAHLWTIYLSILFLSIFTIASMLIAPFQLNIWLIAGFLYFTLFFEWKQRRYVFMRFLLERYYGKKETRVPSISPIIAEEEELLLDVLEKFRRGCKHSIVVEGKDGEKGVLDENEVLHACFSERMLSGKIGDLLYVF